MRPEWPDDTVFQRLVLDAFLRPLGTGALVGQASPRRRAPSRDDIDPDSLKLTASGIAGAATTSIPSGGTSSEGS